VSLLAHDIAKELGDSVQHTASIPQHGLAIRIIPNKRVELMQHSSRLSWAKEKFFAGQSRFRLTSGQCDIGFMWSRTDR